MHASEAAVGSPCRRRLRSSICDDLIVTSKTKPPSPTRLAIAVEGEGLVAALEEARRAMTAKGIVYDSTAIIAVDRDEEEKESVVEVATDPPRGQQAMTVVMQSKP
jgi:hypothetical protein